MNTSPTIWGRMLSLLSGEVPADTLEAYRRASLAVYDALEHCEQHRAKAKEEGLNAWTLPPATQAELLCAWNAFVLQSLGDHFLEADYVTKPTTAGFVPPITADQILAFYSQVEGWLNRAQQAHYNPRYNLDVAVPAEFPAWSEVQPCPEAHMRAMMEAMRAIRDHIEVVMLFVAQSSRDRKQEDHLNTIRQLHAAAVTKARYADDMYGSHPTREVQERVEIHVKEVLERFYHLGQVLAMPTLAATSFYQPGGQESDIIGSPTPENASDPRSSDLFPPLPSPPLPRVAVSRPALPGDPEFNPWCLTHPGSIERWKEDAQARRAISDMWKYDPDPARTLSIQAQIKTALERGNIRLATDRYGQELGHFFRCPWSPVYEVVRPVTIGGQRLRARQQFTIELSAEGANLGKEFKRELVIGTFQPTVKVEYCNPNELRDEDDKR